MIPLARSNSDCCLTPLDSARFIMERARHVSINVRGVRAVAAMVSSAMLDGGLTFDDWTSGDIGPPKGSPELIVDWIFLIDTLNFSFWTDDEHGSYSRHYKGKRYHGYEALCAAINQAIDNGIDLLNAEFYSRITMTQLEEIFRPDNASAPMPMLSERLSVLHETGSLLIKEYSGHFARCVEASEGSAVNLLELIVLTFPSFRDEAVYDGQRVSFYKRAQIVVADIWACFAGHGLGHFTDMDHLTMFADYRVPQVLLHEGVLVYSPSLKERLNRKEQLPFGDPDEVEIRGASILAVHLVTEHANEKIPLEIDTGDGNQRLNAPLIDVFLWRRRREQSHVYENTPYHRTRSIFY